MKRTAIVLLAAWLLAGGCNWFEDLRPNEARLVIRGESDKPVRLIVSTKFVASVTESGQTGVEIFVADTVVTVLPYEKVYRIDKDQRFFVEAARLDIDLQNVTMQVFVDSRKQFDEARALVQGQPYRFVYLFNQQTTRLIVVI